MADIQTDSGAASPFYVGYLTVPRMLVVFLRVAVLLTISGLIVLALMLATSQPDPGTAVWNDAIAKEYRGTMIAWPYPLLLVEKATQPQGKAMDPPRVFLLVETGKHGLSRESASLSGQAVVLSGWLLDRDGRRMLELEPTASSLVQDKTGQAIALPPVKAMGTVTIRGEIVDSKCYLGAMKPGEGKTHKACATLCIKGGIPPLLISPTEGGGSEYTLLCDERGDPIGKAIWPVIAEPVSVTGDLEVLGDLRRLKVKAGGIVRQ